MMQELVEQTRAALEGRDLIPNAAPHKYGFNLFSHNTPIEVLWTVVPVLILMFIAIFSFKLLFEEHDMPRPDLTVKVVGRQWNWDYEYPDPP